MLHLYSNPTALDFLLVAYGATEDQKQQWETLTGLAWDHEASALGAYQTQGPKWVVKTDDHRPILVAGYNFERPGVWRDFLISTDEAWAGRNWAPVTRFVNDAMKSMFEHAGAHRLECVSLASRTKAHRWYKAVGLKFEGTLHKYCANGEDAMMFARVKES